MGHDLGVPTTREVPSYDDPVVAGTVAALGGPPGRYSRLDRTGFWTPVRWIVLLTLIASLFGWWQKSPCRVHPWVEDYQYTRGCYSDVFALYFAERLAPTVVDGVVVAEGRRPYLEHPVEYPVVIGAVMAVAAKAVTPLPPELRPRHFYDVTWAILTACALVVAVTTSRLAGRRRPWDAAIFAAAPLLVLHGSTNWDLVAMAFAGLGLLQWARHRPLAAGVLLGLATATKLYPVLFLVPLFALCLRAGRLRAWRVTAAALVLTPVLVSLPVYLTSPFFADVLGQQTQVAGSPLSRLAAEGLSALAPTVATVSPEGLPVTGVNAAYRFFELNTTRPADWDSLWFVLQQARGGVALDSPLAGEAPQLLNRGVAVLFVAALVGIVVLVLVAPRRPRLAPVLFLTVLAFLLTNKVWSPQFSLWLLPLAALARPRWRMLLAWQAAEALVLLTRFYFFVGGSTRGGEGIEVEWFIGAVLLRDAVLVGLAVLVIREVLAPGTDVVRRAGRSPDDERPDDVRPGDVRPGDGAAVDDPMGGVLDGAPDARERAPA